MASAEAAAEASDVAELQPSSPGSVHFNSLFGFFSTKKLRLLHLFGFFRGTASDACGRSSTAQEEEAEDPVPMRSKPAITEAAVAQTRLGAVQSRGVLVAHVMNAWPWVDIEQSPVLTGNLGAGILPFHIVWFFQLPACA